MKTLIPVNADPESTLEPQVDLRTPRPFRVLFPVLLDGDQLVTSPEHLGVGYLVSVLRNAGADCRVVDVPAESDAEVLAIVHEWRPDLVGITLTTVSSAHARAFGQALRASVAEGTYVLAGGPLASYRGRALLELPGWEFLDGLIRGEGELPILRLAEALHTGGDLAGVPNLSYRFDGEVRQNELVSAIHDLDQVPFPARDQFEQAGGELSPRFKFLRLSTSRGCTSFCTFCNAPHARNRIEPGPIWRGCTPTRVVDEIEELYNRYGCRSYAVVDSTFEDPGGTSKAKWRLACIAQEILDRKLQVYLGVCMQARNWTDKDQDVLDLLWRAGLEYVLVGIEAGTDEDLRLWKKRSNVVDNERIVRMLRASNIYVQFGFISFHPYTSFQTLRESYDFLYRNGVAHNFKKFLDRLELYAGAEIVETLRSDGLLLPTYDDECDEFGYRFRDERVGALCDALHGLFGEGYHQHYAVPQALYKFEGDDSGLHIFFSRLAREYRDDEVASEIIREGQLEADRVRDKMAEYNYALALRFVDLAEEGRLRREDVTAAAPELNEFVLSHVQQLRSVQMKASVRLRHAGRSLEPAGIESLS